MKNLLKLFTLLLLVTFSNQAYSQWVSYAHISRTGTFIPSQDPNTSYTFTNGWAGSIGVYYDFDGEKDGFSTAVGMRMGYLDWTDPYVDGIRRTNTLGLTAYIGDEERFYFGPFVDYLWSGRTVNVGLDLHGTLLENVFIPGLSLELGGSASHIVGDNIFIISPRIGLKFNLRTPKKTSNLF